MIETLPPAIAPPAARCHRLRMPFARTWRVLLIVVIALAGGVARAGEDAAARPTAAAGGAGAAVAPSATPSADRRPSATLTVFNRPIITFRSAFLGISPQERAATAHARILALLERGGEGRSHRRQERARQSRHDRWRACLRHLGKRRRAAFGRNARHGHRRGGRRAQACDCGDAGSARRPADARRRHLGRRRHDHLPVSAGDVALRRPLRHPPHAAPRRFGGGEGQDRRHRGAEPLPRDRFRSPPDAGRSSGRSPCC